MLNDDGWALSRFVSDTTPVKDFRVYSNHIETAMDRTGKWAEILRPTGNEASTAQRAFKPRFGLVAGAFVLSIFPIWRLISKFRHTHK